MYAGGVECVEVGFGAWDMVLKGDVCKSSSM